MLSINRRTFLKRLSIATGAVIAANSVPWLSVFNDKTFAKGPNDRVRLGFIGIGDRGRVLLLNVLSFEKQLNVEVAAICDNYPPNYERAIKMTGGNAKPFKDYRELLAMKDLDGVIVATPLTEHAHIVIDALNAGLHVFCEKSMARTVPDAKKMYDEHLNAKRILQIGHQRMFSPIYLTAIDRIANGDIGQLTHVKAYWHRNGDWRRPVPSGHPELDRVINWRLYKDLSAGLFTELLSHHLQVACWFKKSFPVSVVANGGLLYWKKNREVYDHISCLYAFADDSQFVYDSINSNKHYGCEIQILGSKGTMEMEVNKYYPEEVPTPPGILQLINDVENGIFDTIPIGGASWIPETAATTKGSRILENNKEDESKLELEAFSRFIRKGSAPEELSVQGYYTTVWTLLAEQAADTKERVVMDEKYRI